LTHISVPQVFTLKTWEKRVTLVQKKGKDNQGDQPRREGELSNLNPLIPQNLWHHHLQYYVSSTWVVMSFAKGLKG